MPRTSAQVLQTRVSSMSVSPTSRQTQRSSRPPQMSRSSRPTVCERIEAGLEIVARVLAGHDRAHAGLAQRDGREDDRRGEDAALEQPGRELLRLRLVAGDDRRDRRLADAGVEAELLQARLEEAGVVPQPLDALRLVLQHVDGGDARGRHGRRLRGREEQRPAALGQVVLEVLPAGDVAAHHADGLGQRADLDVDAAVEVEVVDRAAAVAAEHARRVRVVDHDRRFVPVGDVADAGQRRDVAVHREDAVGDDQDRSIRRRSGRPMARASRSTFSSPSTSRCGKTARDAFDSRTPSMIEAWLSSSLTIRSRVGRDRRDRAAVGGQARLQRQHRLDVLEIGQPPLELLDQLRRAGDRAHGAGARRPARGLPCPPPRRDADGWSGPR